MTDFAQTMKNWRRMCDYYGEKYKDNCCSKCPINEHYCSAIFEIPQNIDYEEITNIVTAWTNEHPLIHYITWREYFHINGFDLDCEVPEQVGKKLGLRPFVTNYD